MSIRLFFICLLVAFSVSTQAVMPDIETYGKLESVSDMSISPNGELIAYRLTESDEKDFIVILSIVERKVISAVNVKKIDPQGHYFVNNDYLVFIGSSHLKLINYTDSFDASIPFSFNVKTKKIEKLVKLGESVGRRFVTLGQSGLGNVAGKTPDGKNLFVQSYISEDETDVVPKYSLLSVKITGKGSPKIKVSGTRDTVNFFMDDQGNVLARENLNDRTNVHSIDIKKKNGWKTIYEYQSDIKTHTFAGLSSDNQGIVFTRDDDDVGYLLLSLADGSVTEIKELSLERDTTGLIKNEHGVVVGMKYAGFTPDYKILDQEVNKRLEDIVARFEGQSVHLVDWTPDWKHLVVRVEGSSYVGDYLVFTQGKQPFKLASSRLSISGEQINPVVIENYTSRDGIEIPTLLTFPRDRATTPNNLPTVILPHGGPAAQDRMGFNYKAQALASRGFLVIQPQFRGSTGFGTKLYEAGWGEWGKGMQNDLTDAIKAFKEKGFVDSNKVCIVGSSYGGYAALAGAAFTPDLYKCAVSINGVSHLPKMLAADKKRYGKKSWVLDYWNRSILNSDFDRESLKASSPYYSADKIKVPVLLIHGEDDKIVEINQSKLMHKAIKKNKGQVEFIKLKNDDHHLQDSKTRVQALKATVEFVEKHIGS